jgi:quercetin dioxygenase-like cupin family protein
MKRKRNPDYSRGVFRCERSQRWPASATASSRPAADRGYDWSKDHTFVKVSSSDTGGAFALMEDNLKLEFALGLHLHRQHAETFYVLDGEINFYIDGDW